MSLPRQVPDDERDWLRSYDPGAFPPFGVTVDVVVLTVTDGRFSVLLVERDTHPFRGDLALPGGFVQPQEDLDAAAVRRLERETGIRRGSPREGAHVEQLGAFGAPDRDPRMRVVSVAYLVFAPDLPAPVPGRTTRSVAWVPVDDVDTGRLAFDHDRVLAAGVERARAKLEYTPLAAAFCDDELTVADLRRVYEAVWGTPLDPRNFHRKVTGTPGFLEPLGRPAPVGPGGGRPAACSAAAARPRCTRPCSGRGRRLTADTVLAHYDTVLAHYGGAPEALTIALPVAIFTGFLLLEKRARRREREAAERQEPPDTGA